MKPLFVFAVFLAACSNATAPIAAPVLHIGNAASEAVTVSYRPASTGGSWMVAGTIPAGGGRCLVIAATGPTVLNAQSQTSSAVVSDSADLTTAADWRWDIDVTGGVTQLEAIPTVCIGGS